jgi:riboflavin kinase/FMN adenylyltransferase
MQVYSLNDKIPFNPASVITVGTFDGLHKGHQHIIHEMRSLAAQQSLDRVIVVTFDPHPQIVIARQDKPAIRLLSTLEERLELLEAYGVDTVIVIPFSREFAQTSSEDFIRTYIAGKIGVHTMFIGYDHGFGRERSGSEETLRNLGQELGFEVVKIPALEVNGQAISSTKIRQALRENRLVDSLDMLGYPYFLEGTVQRGDERGRKLGIPTANIKSADPAKLYPGNGVYFVSSEIDGKLFYGMANIGLRPTFTNDLEPTLEVNYFGLNQDLYDKKIKVWFLRFLREEKKFDSVDLFLSQLYDDRAQCEEMIEQIEKHQTKQI